jgi:hypothetical protein
MCKRKFGEIWVQIGTLERNAAELKKWNQRKSWFLRRNLSSFVCALDTLWFLIKPYRPFIKGFCNSKNVWAKPPILRKLKQWTLTGECMDILLSFDKADETILGSGYQCLFPTLNVTKPLMETWLRSAVAVSPYCPGLWSTLWDAQVEILDLESDWSTFPRALLHTRGLIPEKLWLVQRLIECWGIMQTIFRKWDWSLLNFSTAVWMIRDWNVLCI